MKLVSVIIPFYNQGELLEQCIQSVHSQTYENIETVIINDGSNEINSINVLEKIKIKYPNTKIISIENSGVAKARNIGIMRSQGEFILPLDADDKIASKYIEKCVEALKNNKNIDIVYCIGKCFGYKNGIFVLDDFSEQKMLKKNLVFCSALYRRTDFYQTCGYNSNMTYGNEDWDFWLSMIELGKKFYRINEILFFYRLKIISRNTEINKFNNKQSQMMKQLIDNHRQLYFNYNVDVEHLIKINFKEKNIIDYIFIRSKYIFQKIKLNCLIIIEKYFNNNF